MSDISNQASEGLEARRAVSEDEAALLRFVTHLEDEIEHVEGLLLRHPGEADARLTLRHLRRQRASCLNVLIS